MLTRQYPLEDETLVTAPVISDENEIPEALTQLDIPHPRSVIVLIGGAKGINWLERFPMRRAIKIIAKLAQETDSVVVDGGTKSGIMKEIGEERKENNFSFPLVGVLFDQLLMRRDSRVTLDPNHTHFLLVPGERWGDESAWISKVATQIAGNKKSITVLVNGGRVAKSDVDNSLLADRPTFVMRGTGRMADEILAAEKVIPIKFFTKASDIKKQLKSRLL